MVNQSEKRVFTRFPCAKTVKIVFNGVDYFGLCADYSIGGAFVRDVDQKLERALASIDTHQHARQGGLQLQFQLSKDYWVKGEIVRHEQNIYAIRFSENQYQLVKELNQMAKDFLHAALQTGPSESDPLIDFRLAMVLRTDLARTAKNWLTKKSTLFFPLLREELFKRAENAGSNQEQAKYFDFRNHLMEVEAELGVRYFDYLKKLFSNKQVSPDSEHITDASGSLSLVDKSEFTDWLQLHGYARKAEAVNQVALYQLEVRIAALNQVSLVLAQNPLSPDRLCDSLHHMISGLTEDADIRGLIFHAYNDLVLTQLAELCDLANKVFIERNVLPLVKVDASVQKNASQLQEQAKSTAEPIRPAPSPQKPSTAPARSDSAGDSQSMPMPMGNGAEAPAAMPNLSSKGVSTIQQIMEGGGCWSEPVKEVFSRESLVGLLGSMGSGRAMPILEKERTLKNYFTKELERKGISYRANVGFSDQCIIQFASDFMDCIFTSNILTDKAKQCFRKLESSIAKAMLSDRKLLEDKFNPLRVLLNQLTGLALKGQSISQEWDRSIGEAVDAIVNQPIASVQTIVHCSDLLNHYLKEQYLISQTSISRIVEACDGKQKVEDGKRKVAQLVNERLVGRKVPLAFVELINGGWQNAMFLCLVRADQQSKSWDLNVELFDEVIEALSDYKSGSAAGLKKWKERLTNFLDASTSGTFSHGELVNNLYEALMKRLNYPSIPKTDDCLVALVSQKAKYSNQSNIIFLPDAEEEKLGSQWEAAAVRARSLKVGDWLYQPNEPEKSQYVKLVWINSEKTRFAVVNLQGVKCGEWKLKDVSVKFLQNTLMAIGSDDLALINLGIEAILKRVMGQMTYQPDQQAEAGLVDRVEFERKLKAALDSAIHKKARHVLGFIMVHQMDLVRREYGYNANDHLLREFAKRIALPGNRNYTLSIVSNEQFCFLLESCDEEQAMQMVLAQIQRVKDADIVVDGVPHDIDISVGLANINQESETVPALLNQAEIASIAATKEGRNTLKIFSTEDDSIAKILSMREWAKKVHGILDEELLRLRVQKILPLKGNSHKPLYEILLGVVSNNDEIVSPSEFIAACEEHHMMVDVDLWVISNCLQWMAKHLDLLNAIEGIAIKIANESLQNDHFAQYLLEQAEKYSVPLDKICLEIEESGVSRNLAVITPVIDRLSAAGCKCTIDSFGTGSQSYAYLEKLKVNFLKIDGSLAKGMATQKSDLLMGRSIIVIGRASGKRIIAEHIENQDVFNKMKQLGVDYGQGNFIAPAMLLEALQLAP